MRLLDAFSWRPKSAQERVNGQRHDSENRLRRLVKPLPFGEAVEAPVDAPGDLTERFGRDAIGQLVQARRFALNARDLLEQGTPQYRRAVDIITTSEDNFEGRKRRRS